MRKYLTPLKALTDGKYYGPRPLLMRKVHARWNSPRPAKCVCCVIGTLGTVPGRLWWRCSRSGWHMKSSEPPGLLILISNIPAEGTCEVLVVWVPERKGGLVMILSYPVPHLHSRISKQCLAIQLLTKPWQRKLLRSYMRKDVHHTRYPIQHKTCSSPNRLPTEDKQGSTRNVPWSAKHVETVPFSLISEASH